MKPVLVEWDYDHGWLAMVDEDGEYETADFHGYECDGDSLPAMVDVAIKAARDRGERVHVYYEWPERVAEKERSYRRIKAARASAGTTEGT